MSPAEPTQVTPRLLREWPLPEAGSSKYLRGRVLVIGGAVRTPGAVQLAGIAALRVGAGHLSLAVAKPAAVALAVSTPESGVTGLACDHAGSVLSDDLPKLAKPLEVTDAVVLGPGLDRSPATAQVVATVLAMLGSETRLVVDALALHPLTGIDALTESLAARMVLTPNDDEASELLGRPLSDDLLADIGSLAARFGTVVACHDLVVQPDGKAWQISVGDSGLATSGSGDVLAGALGGLLARGAEPAQAACWAKYLHAAAGERLASRIGRLGFLAGEIRDELPMVLAEIG